MREHSIILNQREVLALLDNRLTQIRRVVKPQPVQVGDSGRWLPSADPDDRFSKTGVWFVHEAHMREKLPVHFSPFGTVGDRLIGKETFATDYEQRKGIRAVPPMVYYRATDRDGTPWTVPVWLPSIRMPIWASRITLENISIRVERVQEITEEDAIACGVHLLWIPTEEERSWKRIPTFRALWDMQNPKHPWESNPWTWVLNVKRINEKG